MRSIFSKTWNSTRRYINHPLYEQLRTTCTHIIHNAWRLDFNISITSLESNIRGTRNLIDLALTSPNASNFRFIFTSSIGVSSSWDRENGPFPEESDLPPETAVGNGYGESKYTCEQLLVKASKNGLQTSSIRIGQICGGQPAGSWATTDWVPILIKSSRALGALPDALGVATWLPTEAVAHATLDIAFAPERIPSAMNILHPRPVSWTKVMQGVSTAIAKILDEGKAPPLPFVSFKDWTVKLAAAASIATEDDFTKIPALKLLQFFQGFGLSDEALRPSGRMDLEVGGMARFATQKAESVSLTLREVGPIGDEHAEMWVRYWQRKGLFV